MLESSRPNSSEGPAIALAATGGPGSRPTQRVIDLPSYVTVRLTPDFTSRVDDAYPYQVMLTRIINDRDCQRLPLTDHIERDGRTQLREHDLAPSSRSRIPARCHALNSRAVNTDGTLLNTHGSRPSTAVRSHCLIQSNSDTADHSPETVHGESGTCTADFPKPRAQSAQRRADMIMSARQGPMDPPLRGLRTQYSSALFR
jgi:hypothetical protein